MSRGGSWLMAAIDREVVPGPAEALDGAGDVGRDHRAVAPRLPGHRVRHVQLDLRPLERRERVGDRVRVVPERTGVDDDRRARAPGGLDRVDERTFVVRLEVVELVAVRRRGRTSVADEIVE